MYPLKPVHPGRIATGDLGFLLLGTVHQDLLKNLLALRESGFHMGIVGAPLEAVHPNYVPQPYAQFILLESQEDVAVEIVAGLHVLLEPVPFSAESLLVVGVVEAAQEVRHPAKFVLHYADL